MTVLGLTAAALLAAGTFAPTVRRFTAAALPLQALGLALVGAVGAATLFGANQVGSGFTSALTLRLGIDGLSGFFLATIALVALPALLYAHGYLSEARNRRALIGLTGGFLSALVAVVCARDVVSFLSAWELMTLVPASAILVARQTHRVRRAVYVYLSVTHLGGAGVWIALLVLAHQNALGATAATGGLSTGLESLVLVCAVIGFGTKAGLMPLHSWLPRAHPVAPSHISALMSGLMIKVALYGLIRVAFQWIGTPPAALGYVLLGLGGLSALAGVVYAVFQRDLKRLLAFSSIENDGIVVLALGAAALFAAHGERRWMAIAFGAALLHILNHAVFKALLFLGAGAFERATHTLEIDHLGGLLRRMPWTGAAFLVGCAAIAGLPPLNGFASEWLTLQSLLHLVGPHIGISLAGALAAAALAATAGLSVLCFVKVIGLVLLGRPRREQVADAVEAPWSMRLATGVLAAGCVVLGAVPSLVLPSLAGLSGFFPLTRGFSLTVPGTGHLPTLAIALVVTALSAGLYRVSRGRVSRVTAPVWFSGQRLVPELAWTSAAFTKPLQLVLEPVLRPERTIEVRSEAAIVQSVDYRVDVPHLFDTAVYRPVVTLSLRAAAIARRLQSGSLRLYLVYLGLLLLLALLAVRTGVLQ
jgi:hydrogenase-4 component B